MKPISLSAIKRTLDNKYIINLLWTFFEKIIHLISVLIVGILLARYLGPEQYGVLAYVQSYVAMFGFLVGLGLDSITVREIVKSPDKSNAIVATSFSLKLFMSFIIIFIINITSYKFNDSEEINLMMAILSLSLIYQAFYVFVNYFQAKVNIRAISILIVLSNIILIIVKIALIVNESSLINFIIVDVVVLMLLGISYFFVYKAYQRLDNFYKLFTFDFSIAKKMLLDSWPLMLSSGAIMLYMRLDQVMIKEMLTLEDLGNYAVSVRISEAWYFIPMIISGVLYPSIIKAKETSIDLYNLRFEQLFFLTLWIGILLSLFIFIFSDNIIQILFGNQFNIAGSALSILAFTGIFVSMGYVNGKYMIIENFTRLELVRSLAGLGVNVCLNIILIPLYGINGAALSTLVSVMVSADLMMFFNKKTRKMFYLQNISLFKFYLLKSMLNDRKY